MRSSLKWSVVWGMVGLMAAAAAQASEPAEERAQRRQEAREVVAQTIQERSVRAVDPKVVAADAKRIVRSLSDEQVDRLLAEEDLVRVLAQDSTATAESDEPRLGKVTAAVVGDSESDLLFVPLSPCRIIDTRSGGGILNVDQARHFKVAGTDGFPEQGGTAGGCGVPQGATTPLAAAVMINLIAVDAQGRGNMGAWEFNQPEPFASAINFQALNPPMNIANGLIVPIAGVSTLTHDLTVEARISRVHLIADVTGYFTRFPVENFQGGLKSELITSDLATLTDMSDGACKELNSCTVTAEVDCTVVVEAWAQFVVNHTAGTLDRVAIGIETVSPVVCNDSDSVNASDFEVSAGHGTNPDVDFTVSHGRSFAQTAGTTRTYRLSGQMLSGANSGDEIENSRLICTFIPD
jgi:hypothetical protein